MSTIGFVAYYWARNRFLALVFVSELARLTLVGLNFTESVNWSNRTSILV